MFESRDAPGWWGKGVSLAAGVQMPPHFCPSAQNLYQQHPRVERRKNKDGDDTRVYLPSNETENIVTTMIRRIWRSPFERCC